MSDLEMNFGYLPEEKKLKDVSKNNGYVIGNSDSDWLEMSREDDYNNPNFRIVYDRDYVLWVTIQTSRDGVWYVAFVSKFDYETNEKSYFKSFVKKTDYDDIVYFSDFREVFKDESGKWVSKDRDYSNEKNRKNY